MIGAHALLHLTPLGQKVQSISVGPLRPISKLFSSQDQHTQSGPCTDQRHDQ